MTSDKDNIYIGIPRESTQEELDALISLICNEFNVIHNGREFLEVSNDEVA